MGSEGVLAVVSDHGFLPVEKSVNLLTQFHQEGLIDAEDYNHVKSWSATGWASGASAVAMINAKAPLETKAKAGALLGRIARDPDSGVARVLDSHEIDILGGCPAEYLVELKPGFTFGGRATGPLVTPSTVRGMHGFLPSRPEMNASFFLTGPGIEHARPLGEIDMRDIAPTLAAILGIKLETAEGRDLFAQRPGK